MAEYTGISWADATFNPWIGCAKVSPGCANCYAETLVHGRMGRAGTWGEDGTRERTADAYWRRPFRWNRLADQGLLPGGAPNLDGHRPRIFCASLADVFEPRPELAPWRQDLFENVIAATPNLDWMLLTKRPEEALAWLTAFYDRSHEAFGHAAGASGSWQPLPNVWIGVSIENLRHTYRADVLRQIPAAVRFISAEPLLGSLYPAATSIILDEGYIDLPGIERPPLPAPGRRAPLNLEGIDWVIIGGESGGKDARPMHPAWAREIRDAVLDQTCDECAGSTWDTPPRGWEPGEPCHRCSGTGREDTRPALHMKQFGSHDENGVYRGPWPTSGGCLLDGVEWKEFPGVPVAV